MYDSIIMHMTIPQKPFSPQSGPKSNPSNTSGNKPPGENKGQHHLSQPISNDCKQSGHIVLSVWSWRKRKKNKMVLNVCVLPVYGQSHSLAWRDSLSHVMTKPVFGVCDGVRLKPAYSTTEATCRIEPGHEKMFLMSYANSKGADQPLFSLLRQYNVSRFYSRNFKTLASFCDCAGRFVSGLVGNSRRHVLSCRGSDRVLEFGIQHIIGIMLSRQRTTRRWSDCADAQVNLRLCYAHMA